MLRRIRSEIFRAVSPQDAADRPKNARASLETSASARLETVPRRVNVSVYPGHDDSPMARQLCDELVRKGCVLDTQLCVLNGDVEKFMLTFELAKYSAADAADTIVHTWKHEKIIYGMHVGRVPSDEVIVISYLARRRSACA